MEPEKQIPRIVPNAAVIRRQRQIRTLFIITIGLGIVMIILQLVLFMTIRDLVDEVAPRVRKERNPWR